MAANDVLKASFTRVFTIEDRAAPNNSPEYLGQGRAQGIDWGQGSITPVRQPSPTQYGQFVTVDIIRGAPDLPSITLEKQLGLDISDFLRITQKGCEFDVHIHAGSCQNPSDFDGGFDVAWVFEGAVVTNYSTGELGALDPDQEAAVPESIDISAQEIYQIKKIRPGEMAASAITDRIVRVLICDSKTCGECGRSSDGCQIMFALAGASVGSPGLPAELLYSEDGGATWSSTNITTLAVGDDATDAACVGTNLVVISADSNSLHYASINDILNGEESWTEVATGFVSSQEPSRIFSLDRTHTWFAAAGGYVYFTDDITSGVEVQTDGSVSAQDLNDIHALDSKTIVAVGANNVVLSSTNGGISWSLITGPSVGVALNAVFAQTEGIWMVGTNGGELYFTTTGGASWVEKGFTGSGTGAVRQFAFATRNVGYMVHDRVEGGSTRARLLRTYNGGNTWVVSPEESGVTVPSVQSLLSVAACQDDPNVAIVGGIAVNGTDGYAAKYA